MMANDRNCGPFKDSDERRDYESIMLSRRQGSESKVRMERCLGNVYRHTDMTLTHQMRKMLQTQTKINSRIQDIRKKERPTLIRSVSLPRIDEKTEFSDPYPITFSNRSSVPLSGGGKAYPRQRRKSREFEDLPSLSYQLTSRTPPHFENIKFRANVRLRPVNAEELPLSARPIKDHNTEIRKREDPTSKKDLPSNLSFQNTASNVNVLSHQNDGRDSSLNAENDKTATASQNNKQLTTPPNKPITTSQNKKLFATSQNDKLLANPQDDKLVTLSQNGELLTTPQIDSPLITPRSKKLLTNIDRQIIVGSPLGRRKLNTIISSKLDGSA